MALDRTAYWSTEAKEYRLKHNRAEYLDELKTEAISELEKVFAGGPGYGYRETIDYDSFEYRIVTEYSDGHIVEMEMDDLGRKPRVPIRPTNGLTWREAQSVRQDDIRSQLNFLVENAGKPINDPVYPARLIYQCTLTANSVRVVEPPVLKAQYFSIGSKGLTSL